MPLGDDNGALRLTTARYYTPSGRSIQAKGITPDIQVLEDVPADLKGKEENYGRGVAQGPSEERHRRIPRARRPMCRPNEKDDKQLIAAVEFLHGVKHAEAPAAAPSPTPVAFGEDEPPRATRPKPDAPPPPEPTKSN